ncbi:MAG: GNAT family N-acetyltransferase [Actinomycetales bacterium]|nr:GNAT family N-acetyltransferase [Actinomycetales bacterium]
MRTVAPDPAGSSEPESPPEAGGSRSLPLVVRPALRHELAAAGRVARDAYLADGFDDVDYAASLADAEGRACFGEVAVALVGGRVVGSVTFVHNRHPGDPGLDAAHPDTAHPESAHPDGTVPRPQAVAGAEPLCEVSEPGEAEFRMLGVVPDARGLGVGTALVDWCVTRARQVGAPRLLLSTCEKMSAARHIYVTRGFRCVDELGWRTDDGVELLVYRLDLTG